MKKIKQFIESENGKIVLSILILILTGLGSFGLGRLSKGVENNGMRVLYKNLDEKSSVTSSFEPSLSSNQENNLNISSNVNSGQNNLKKGFVASKIGHKYYPIGCPAGENLKSENKIYFTTEKEAIEAGYSKSSSC